MTLSLRGRAIAAILLDIEGTTTPIAFVHDVLFPFARARLGAYFRELPGAPGARDVIRLLQTEHAADVAAGAAPPPWRDSTPAETVESAASYCEWLMDRDRKSPALKRLQGEIWELGYRRGELRGEVFADTASAIQRWRREGVEVAIYSSGSVLAQRLLFESTPAGDLTSLLAGFFDTGVGPKTSSESYTRIAHALGREPSSVLFVSDIAAELHAARAAGLQVLLSIRPGNRWQPDAHTFESIRSFDEITGAG